MKHHISRHPHNAASASGATTAEPRISEYREAVDGAAALSIRLGAGASTIAVRPLDEHDQLMAAALEHLGDLEYSVEGTETRLIRITEKSFKSLFGNRQPMRWDVGLNPAIPLSIEASAGDGDVLLPLDTFDVRRVSAAAGSGDVQISLAKSAEAVPVSVNVGSGDLALKLATGARVRLDGVHMASGDVDLNAADGVALDGDILLASGDIALTGGAGLTGQLSLNLISGDMRLKVPHDLAIRIEVKLLVSGRVNVPTHMTALPREGLFGLRKAWESPEFTRSGGGFTLSVSLVSGSLTMV
ncbi:MAG: DUF4097 family beta strand repeat protein [Pleurocapsa minor GSE-CHR-MK-17-07R]|jgi:hypothetical protein|nr:DUF4097 family beta strand repeat protein [Pleurocapsa minor GSE-CHR-MK 17-07R]